MADQQRWFKLWFSALLDDHLQDLTPAQRWAWAAFGAFTKVYGDRGRVQISPNNVTLAAVMGVTAVDMMATIKVFPHVVVEEGQNGNGHFIVTWQNWHKYQVDSTVAKRVASLRSKRREEENKRKRKKREPSSEGSLKSTALSGKPDDAQILLNFLNHKTGKNYQSPVNADFIRARLRAGATEAQCRAVIGRKVREWKGTDMEKYLRPATLFNATKFAQYLGELPATAFSPEEEPDAH